MNADELRRPLTARQRAALEESCRLSGVPLKVTDPVAISRAAATLRETKPGGGARDQRAT